MAYHVPVLAEACLEMLDIKPDGVYVDATFGGGGHSRLILERLGPQGILVAFDQDEDAQRNLPADDQRLRFAPTNFRYLRRYLRLYGIAQIDGLLADLGVSSFQFDEGERGFSFRFDTELDMRMDQSQPRTAAQLLAEVDADELQDILGRYGEVRNARTLAIRLVEAQRLRPILTVGDLLGVVDPLVRGQRARYLAQVFQALRIALNDEMGALEDLLSQATEVLKPGGRLVVMSYHSLEDRLVKNYLKYGNAAGVAEQDFYGHIKRPYQLLTKKPLLPTAEEIGRNPRARSAKLRAAQRQDEKE